MNNILIFKFINTLYHFIFTKNCEVIFIFAKFKLKHIFICFKGSFLLLKLQSHRPFLPLTTWTLPLTSINYCLLFFIIKLINILKKIKNNIINMNIKLVICQTSFCLNSIIHSIINAHSCLHYHLIINFSPY